MKKLTEEREKEKKNKNRIRSARGVIFHLKFVSLVFIDISNKFDNYTVVTGLKTNFSARNHNFHLGLLNLMSLAGYCHSSAQ